MDAPDAVCTSFVSLLLILVACGVYMIIRVGIIKGSYDILLQEGDKYYTTIQKPKTVAWEVSFEGLYPSERRVIKYDLGTEKTFEFNGKGVVLMGMIRQDVKDSNDNYIAILEAYIDGKKVETIEMPYDYIKRKYDIFYNYDLEEGPHKLVIKWINPNEKYAVQCKDMVVYSSTPAEPINPYK